MREIIKPIPNSKIDTDFYQLAMGQAILHHYPDLKGGTTFIDRNKTEYPDRFDEDLKDQIEMMAELKVTREQRRFLTEKCDGVFQEDYLDYFCNEHRFNPDEVKIKRVNGTVEAGADGYLRNLIYWETPFLATVTELMNIKLGRTPQDGWKERCVEKILTLAAAGVLWAEFGARRRFSYDVQDEVVRMHKLYGGKNVVGTSNVEMAMKYDMKAIGTMAHFWVMLHAGLFGVENANRKMMEVWDKEYPGKLTTTLTDTYTTEYFLKDFDRQLAEKFITGRQDSGVPERYVDMWVAHLRELGLDPMKMAILFSDSLNVKRVLEIHEYCRGKIKDLYGIGTSWTNDVGHPATNIVWKLAYILMNDEKINLCKMSDDAGKASGAPDAIESTREKINLYHADGRVLKGVSR